MTYDGDNHDEADELWNYSTSARRVPVMNVTPDQVVLQGEKKYFQFQSDDELRLFQRALDRNHGIFGLGVIIREDDDGDDVMMNKIQLMEITEYNMNLGVDFGIFCTAQAVGRASILNLLDNNESGTSVDERNSIEEPLIAICEEHFDNQEAYFSMEDTNQMARSVVEVIANLSDKEQDVIRKECSDGHDVEILHVVDDDKEDDYDDYEETRKDRFVQAFINSMEADSQGYISNSPPTREGVLSWKEMNAISWAAFSSALTPSEDEMYRLHAMDQDTITDRLKLATYWLSDVVQEVEQKFSSR